MILDSSAVIAILEEEEGSDRLSAAIESSAYLGIGAPTAFESSLVLIRDHGLVGRLALARFLDEYEVILVPFDQRHIRVATEARLRYGKGRHPAALNYGDCMSYATATIAGAPLLFVGDDFARTDVVPV
ncbi:MAG TPA: type II toxin-antitoxin system VapC family toxin [Solirubrobacterales bacterium]|nr:type II toxin-antitoxin system VapC family toxin [Solirubrobacterales bacterium]